MTQYSGLRIKQICENKLGIEFRSGRGSHRNGWYVRNGRKLKRITVPCTRDEVPPKTFGSMARQLGLNKREFDELLRCILDEDEYFALIMHR